MEACEAGERKASSRKRDDEAGADVAETVPVTFCNTCNSAPQRASPFRSARATACTTHTVLGDSGLRVWVCRRAAPALSTWSRRGLARPRKRRGSPSEGVGIQGDAEEWELQHTLDGDQGLEPRRSVSHLNAQRHTGAKATSGRVRDGVIQAPWAIPGSPDSYQRILEPGEEVIKQPRRPRRIDMARQHRLRVDEERHRDVSEEVNKRRSVEDGRRHRPAPDGCGSSAAPRPGPTKVPVRGPANPVSLHRREAPSAVVPPAGPSAPSCTAVVC